MGYRIDYAPQPRRPGGSALLLAVLLAAALLWSRGRELLQDTLLPIDGQAAECFVQELQNGGNLQQALESFCRRCLEDGD